MYNGQNEFIYRQKQSYRRRKQLYSYQEGKRRRDKLRDQDLQIHTIIYEIGEGNGNAL